MFLQARPSSPRWSNSVGLKLESTKAPHGFIAIDHVEPPTEN